MPTYVVRNPNMRDFVDDGNGREGIYLGSPDTFCGFALKNAHRFATLEEAREHASPTGPREILELTYVLKWAYDEANIDERYCDGRGGFTSRSSTPRYRTFKEARRAAKDLYRLPIDNSGLFTGWKVVAVLKKVK